MVDYEDAQASLENLKNVTKEQAIQYFEDVVALNPEHCKQFVGFEYIKQLHCSIDEIYLPPEFIDFGGDPRLFTMSCESCNVIRQWIKWIEEYIGIEIVII